MQSFAEAGAGLRLLADAMSRIVLAPDSPLWRNASRAAREAEEGGAYAGPWGADPLRDAIQSANLLLELAHSHLLGMAILTPAPDVLTAPITLSRTIGTACARSYWLLDPDANTRERLRRAMNVRLASLAERAQLHVPDTDAYIRLESVSRAITETASRHGFEVKTERARPGQSWQTQYLDSRLPTEMALARGLLGDISGFGDLQYRLGSAAVHAQAHGLELLDLGLAGARENAGLRIDLAAFLVQTAGAVMGVYKAGLRSLGHAGVPAYRWERVGLPILKAWGEGMRVLPSTHLGTRR